MEIEFRERRGYNDINKELEEMLKSKRANIKVIGCGGAGKNTLNRITEIGIAGVETIGINTDAQDLLYTDVDRKILIGKKITNGFGAGSDPKIGELAAKETESEIRNSIEGSDMIFITAGMGGGTGTGSAPIVSEVAKRLGILTIAIVTMPFQMEGKKRYENAIYGIEKLEVTADTLIIIPNDKLLEIAPNLPLRSAFKIADEILTNAVKGMAELVTKPGLINLDLADVRAVVRDGGVSMIGVGESDSENRAEEAIERALSNPLLDMDISGARGALINVVGGPNMTLDEAKKIVETVSMKLSEDAKIIWGAQISEDLENTVRVILIITGVASPSVTEVSHKSKLVKNIEKELGLEFLD